MNRPMTSTALDLVRSHYDASAAGDLDGMFAPFAADIAWTEMAGSDYAGTFHGRSEILAGVFGRIDADFRDFGFDPEFFVAEADTVVAIGNYRGTRRSGKSLDVRAVHVWTAAGGQLVRFEQFADTAMLQG